MSKNTRPVAINTDGVAENDNLPLPIVHYPQSGAFFGFKSDREAKLTLCSCGKEAAENAVECVQQSFEQREDDPSPSDLLRAFPDEAVEIVQDANPDLDDPTSVISCLEFRDELCHRCNQVVPKYRACRDMYGTIFDQNYGWYISQRRYDYGLCSSIGPHLTIAGDELPDPIEEVMDDELVANFDAKATRLQELREKRRERDKELNAELDEKIQTYLDKDITELTREEREGDYVLQLQQDYNDRPRLPDDEAQELQALQELFESNRKRVSELIENEVRRELDHYEKGSRWQSETILYDLVRQEFGDDYTIKRHHRPEWLDGLELDIFIVEAQVGIEYQGIQHYEPVDHWGGEEALEDRKERDRRKEELCIAHDVELVEVRYDDDLSEELVERKITPAVAENGDDTAT